MKELCMESKSHAHSCGRSMLPSSSDWSMLKTSRPSWNYQKTAVLPRSCVRHLKVKLLQLHRRLHHAATLGKALQRDPQGEHAYLYSSSVM